MLEVIYLLGIFVAAMSGALVAGFKKMDWVGAMTLAVITALGGGTLRDLLLNRTVFWIERPYYVWVAIVAALFTILYVSHKKAPLKLLLICDAVSLAFFTILGAQIAEAYSESWTVIILMALSTGVAGGVFRDVFANDVPSLFQATEPLYSITAFIGVASYLFLTLSGVEFEVVNMVSISIIILLRLLAIYYNIRLPLFKVKPC